jgi:outer membrane lipoprotein LolB
MIIRSILYSIFLLIAFHLSGCSTQEVKIRPAAGTPNNWPNQSQRLSELKHWIIKGKIGIRSPKSIDSAVINQWQQNDDHFLLDLSSTLFGLGATRIQGDNTYLMIQRSGEKPVFSTQPDALMKAETGWFLPLRQIPYWIKGLAAPGSTFSRTFSEKNHPYLLKQDNWQVQYSHFKQYGEVFLPSKIKFTRGGFKITIIARQWEFPSTQTHAAKMP